MINDRKIVLALGFVLLSMLACNAPASLLAPTLAAPTLAPPATQPLVTPTTGVISSETPAPPADPSGGWTSYANADVGISFQHPAPWVLEMHKGAQPMGGWRIIGPQFELHTNFVGGFEGYTLAETRSVTLGSGQSVEMSVHRPVAALAGEEVEIPNERLVIVPIPDIGPSGLMLYRFDQARRPEGLLVIERLLSTLDVRELEGATTEKAAWQTFEASERGIRFEYPHDWAVLQDVDLETAAGVEGDLMVILGQVGNDDSNDWIRLNPRQFQREHGTCRDRDGHSICTYSDDPAVVDVLDQIVATFETW